MFRCCCCCCYCYCCCCGCHLYDVVTCHANNFVIQNTFVHQIRQNVVVIVVDKGNTSNAMTMTTLVLLHCNGAAPVGTISYLKVFFGVGEYILHRKFTHFFCIKWQLINVELLHKSRFLKFSSMHIVGCCLYKKLFHDSLLLAKRSCHAF